MINEVMQALESRVQIASEIKRIDDLFPSTYLSFGGQSNLILVLVEVVD